MRNPIWRRSALLMVPLLVLALAGAAAASTSRSDQAITSKVEDKLMHDSRLEKSDITVGTKNGEVTLKGTVASQADITRAAQIARSVDGVREVDNRLKTRPLTSSSYGGSKRAAGCPVGANWPC